MKINEKLNLIQTKLSVPKNQRNSFGNYNYRSCEDILEALKPLLKETETSLTINDDLVCIGNRYYVKATATLHSGEENISTNGFARESENKKGMDDSQITGATSSYARKYALNGLFCIDDTKDADSTNTHGKEENPAGKPEVKKPLAKDQGVVSLHDIVMTKAKGLFKDPDEFKLWRVDRGLAENLKEAKDLDLTKVVCALNDRQAERAKNVINK